MISICIPVYNFHVAPLLCALSGQIEERELPVEIILIDDCSSEQYRKANEEPCSHEKYILLDANIGRAKIRNLFLDHARYDHLLFLDCDSLIVTDDFITKYLEAVSGEPFTVICGGRVYPESKPGRKRRLRWTYGIHRESLPIEKRQLHPNRSFMTNNFLIHRKVLANIRFDERIAGYGHEDTLFGYRLRQKGIEIQHINNPVLNGELETNSEYLRKTEEAIINLIQISSSLEQNQEFVSDVTLLQFYHQLSARRLTGMVFFMLKPLIKAMLKSGFVSLTLFDFYKLGFLIRNFNRHSV